MKTHKNKTPLNMALKYLAHRPRSIHEMQTYMAKKGIDPDIVQNTIEILMEKKYLDDLIFTRLLIESRIKNKPKSKFALAYELYKKGISSVLVEDVLREYDDPDLALRALQPKIKLWGDLDDETFKKKALNFLQYRGFGYDVSLSLLSRFTQSDEQKRRGLK